MKKLIFASAVVASFLSAPAAADIKTEAFNACKSEIRSVLGSDTSVKLRKIRGRGDDLRVSVRVNPASSDATTITCLYNEAELSFLSTDKQPLELAALNQVTSDTAIN